jgi:hypothetical protein
MFRPKQEEQNGWYQQWFRESYPPLKSVISLMRPNRVALHYPFSSMLYDWSDNGAPVDCGEPWPRGVIQISLECGNHESARTPEAIKLINEEMNCQVGAGLTTMVPWNSIKDDPPKNLKQSSLDDIPCDVRQDRLILNLPYAPCYS